MRRLLSALAILAAMAATPAGAVSLVLRGHFLEVGVSDSGGLIDDDFTAGIRFDPAGYGVFGPQDYLKPGSPFEFYSLAYDEQGYGAASYDRGNGFGATSKDTSSGATRSARTEGRWGDLGFVQDLWFEEHSNVIHFLFEARNVGPEPLTGVYFARGLDPDQDVYLSPDGEDAENIYWDTHNSVEKGRVTGRGSISGWFITLTDDSGSGVASVSAGWSQDPAELFTGMNDGYGDYTIALAWQKGILEPGESWRVGYSYAMGVEPVPEPGTFTLVGSGLATLALIARRRREG